MLTDLKAKRAFGFAANSVKNDSPSCIDGISVS